MEVATLLLSSRCANASETSLSQPPGEKQAFGSLPEHSSTPCSPSAAPAEDAEPAWPSPPQPWHCTWHCFSPGGQMVSLSSHAALVCSSPLAASEPYGSRRAASLPSAPGIPAPGWGWRGGKARRAGGERSCSWDTFGGRSGLRLVVPAGSCLLRAGHGAPCSPLTCLGAQRALC